MQVARTEVGDRQGEAGRQQAVGNNPQSSQKIKLCQQQLAVKSSAPPGCLGWAREGRLGPVGPQDSQPQIGVLVLLLTGCVVAGELQFSAVVLYNVNDVTNLTDISWENDAVHRRSQTVGVYSFSLLGRLGER